MKKSAKDPVREDRIHEEAIVDAYGSEEKAGRVRPSKCSASRRKRTTCSSRSNGKVEKWQSLFRSFAERTHFIV
jgi:hypothetical protein